MEKRNFTYVALALLVWAISSTVFAGYYFTQYNTYQKEYDNILSEIESILSVNILMSYGNGTRIWHNNTALPSGSTAFKATIAVADVESTGSGLEVFVTSINGVAMNSTHFWLYLGWDVENSEWVFPDVGASQYTLHRGDIIAWVYGKDYPPPPPT